MWIEHSPLRCVQKMEAPSTYVQVRQGGLSLDKGYILSVNLGWCRKMMIVIYDKCFSVMCS